MQSLVIGFLGIGDQFLNTDIFANDIAGAVQEQQCQEPAHAAIPVIEGVDAEKIQNEDGNQQQRVEFSILHSRFKRAAQRRNSRRRFPRRNRLKPDNLLTVRQFFGNHVIRIFEAAADGLTAVFVQIPVKLQNDRWLWRNIVMAFMNRCKHIAVSGNLFFTASFWHCFITHDFLQSVIRGDNSLDAVRRLCALNFRNFQKFRQRILFSLDKEILLPLIFVNLRQVGHDLWRQQFVVFCFEVERSHALPSFEFQFHQILSNDAIVVYP